LRCLQALTMTLTLTLTLFKSGRPGRYIRRNLTQLRRARQFRLYSQTYPLGGEGIASLFASTSFPPFGGKENSKQRGICREGHCRRAACILKREGATQAMKNHSPYPLRRSSNFGTKNSGTFLLCKRTVEPLCQRTVVPRTWNASTLVPRTVERLHDVKQKGKSGL
jgi:hypothetical protein